jgi:hypothetical protein
MMQFTKLSSNFDSIEVWGAIRLDRSYVVSFDHKHPSFGWKASHKHFSALNERLIEGGFPTLQEAIAACQKVGDA